jgi:hypothetical protein
MSKGKDGAMSDDLSGVSRSSWIAIPQAMQQHGQAKRATESRALPSKETAPSDNVTDDNVADHVATAMKSD